MANERASPWQWAFRLLFLALVIVPIVAQWVGPRMEIVGLLDSATLVRVTGLSVVVLMLLLLVGQKRRSRGQRASESAPESSDDRQVEGSGEVYAPYAYNNQQQARRESKRIQNRAEEISEAERKGRNRR